MTRRREHNTAAVPEAPRWLASGEHDVPDDDAWLTGAEAARAAHLRFTKRRREYLLRRWVGKQAVAAAKGLPTDAASLARIEVGNRPDGAPHVLLDGEPLGLDISLTARSGWAACLVGPDLSHVGCDLEVVEPRSATFVVDYLTPAEQAYVARCPEAVRDATATLVWSAKEAALKVLRTGLRQDTRAVEVRVLAHGDEVYPDGVDPGWSALEVRSSEGALLPGWWRRDGTFLLTVATWGPRPEPEPLAGADLGSAEPVHSWLRHPPAD